MVFYPSAALYYTLNNADVQECIYQCLFLTGTAYIHGIKHATGNFVIIMDADLSHHVILSVF